MRFLFSAHVQRLSCRSFLLREDSPPVTHHRILPPEQRTQLYNRDRILKLIIRQLPVGTSLPSEQYTSQKKAT
ncbi:hypothetical protein predicted by Glimmer/Critica [Acetobacter senegalensis]|uniref:Uncharacterized protein n=1 Tax=Acetobacter senegalensis TaxID=446692 RepID=A0A0U5B9V9_9PROT|nr:hypothetical protein predicted by Glimmer/Critica [Acetobacter senegalensis]